MKCIYAEWELRNLGVKTIELSIEKKDSALQTEDLLKEIENYQLEYDAKYVVIKADVDYPSVSLNLQKAGFLLMENQVGLRFNRKDSLEVLEKYREICKGTSYRPASDEDTQMVFSEIEKEIFVTDRISLDPYFGKKIANRRYLFWMKDELSRGARLYISTHNGKSLGFILFKQNTDKKVIIDLLGGLFKRNDSRYLGADMMSIYANRLCFCDSGVTTYKTAVSSNNLKILQLHLMAGAKITTLKNVLIKHFD